MDDQELRRKLTELMALPNEVEWVEFKAAKSDYDFRKLGSYFSALSNEANLNSRNCGWLIFGVSNELPRRVVGTGYREDPAKLDRLKKEVADQTTSRITFSGIDELIHEEGRVLMFEIPPAPRGIPIAWQGHYYGREGESLAPLSIHEIEEIRGQVRQSDWTEATCDGAGIQDLDPEAIAEARRQYKEKNPRLAPEVDAWSDTAFLNTAKVTIQGRITRAALLLLGCEEATHFLSPADPRITWILKDANGLDLDYEHLGPPFVLNTARASSRIRNLRYRYMGSGNLFPTEVSQYDPWVIREALHNAIAHQDYRQSGRVALVEGPESVLVTNSGSFLPGSVEYVIESEAPPGFYRNPYLANAMVALNMIDTIGSGIKRMFRTQRERFFPLPDYDLNDPEKVAVRIYGKILDERYTQLLIAKAGLSLQEVIALDHVQKGRTLTEKQFRLVKSKGLVEGRRPNLYVSSKVAAATGARAQYIRDRALDKAHYKGLVTQYLREYGKAKREHFEDLLIDKLSDALSRQQKRTWVKNLLQEMRRRDKTIRRIGGRRYGNWVLSGQDSP